MASLAVLVGAIVTFIVLLLIAGAGYLVSDTLIAKSSVRQRFVPFSRAQSFIVISVPLCVILGYYKVGGCKACGLWYALSICFHVMGLYSLKYAFLERVIFSSDPPKAREEQSAEEARRRREADRKAEKKRVGKVGHKSRRNRDGGGGASGDDGRRSGGGSGKDGKGRSSADRNGDNGIQSGIGSDHVHGSGEKLLMKSPQKQPNLSPKHRTDSGGGGSGDKDGKIITDEGDVQLTLADRLSQQLDGQGYVATDAIGNTSPEEAEHLESTLLSSGQNSDNEDSKEKTTTATTKGNRDDDYDDESVEESSSSLPTVDYTQETTEAAIYGQMDIQKGTWKEEYVRKDVYEAKIGAALAIPEDGEVDNTAAILMSHRSSGGLSSPLDVKKKHETSSQTSKQSESSPPDGSDKMATDTLQGSSAKTGQQTGAAITAPTATEGLDSPMISNNESDSAPKKTSKMSEKKGEDSSSNSGSGLSASLSQTSKRIQRKLHRAMIEQNGWQLTGAKIQRISLGSSCIFVVLIMCFLIQAKCGAEETSSSTGCNIRYHWFIGVFGCIMLFLDGIMFYQYSSNILNLLNRLTKVDQEKVELVKSDLKNQAKWTIICLLSCFIDTLIGTFWVSFDNLTLVCLDAIVISLANIIMFANPN